MTFDPFADAPTDDQITDNAPSTETKEETSTVQNNTPEVQNVQENNGEVSVTLKGGTGYDSPWIVVRAATPGDALEQLKNKDMGELIEWSAKVGHHFGNKYSETKPAPQNAQPQQSAPAQQNNQQSASQQAPNGQTRQCAHGEMTFRSGVSKAGNAYSGFFCPEKDRNQQCKPQFLPNK